MAENNITEDKKIIEKAKIDQNEINKIKHHINKFIKSDNLKALKDMIHTYKNLTMQIDSDLEFNKKQLDFQIETIEHWKEQFNNQTLKKNNDKVTYMFGLELMENALRDKLPVEEAKPIEEKNPIKEEIPDVKTNIFYETEYFHQTGKKTHTTKGKLTVHYSKWLKEWIKLHG